MSTVEPDTARDALTRPERLGRLPYTRKHTKLLLGSGTGWALDAMDVGLISFVLVVLAKQWDLSTAERSWIVTIGFIGMALGATFGERYAGGESIRSLAESTKRSYGFVHRLLSESGATLRSRGGANRNSKKA